MTVNKVLLAAVVLVLSVTVIVGTFAITERVHQAEANGYIKGRQTEIDAATKRMGERQSAWDSERRELEAERDQIKTAKQAVKVITKVVPSAASGTVEVTKAQLPADVVAKLPDAPSYVCQTQDAAVATAKALEDGVICTKSNVKLAADIVDIQAKLTATTAQRDTAVTANKGGTKFGRIKSAGKWTAIGVAIGYAVAKR